MLSGLIAHKELDHENHARFYIMFSMSTCIHESAFRKYVKKISIKKTYFPFLNKVWAKLLVIARKHPVIYSHIVMYDLQPPYSGKHQKFWCEVLIRVKLIQVIKLKPVDHNPVFSCLH